MEYETKISFIYDYPDFKILAKLLVVLHKLNLGCNIELSAYHNFFTWNTRN